MINRTPVRDKSTWVSYFQATCFGWFVYGFGATLPFLRDDLKITATVASFHSVAMAVGSVSAGLATRQIIGALGRGMLLRVASFGAALGLTLYITGTHISITLLGIAFTAFFGSLIIQGTGAYLSHHQGTAAPAALNELHAMAAGIGLMSPVMVGVGISLGYGWRQALVLPIIGLLVIEFIRGRKVALYGPKFAHDEESEHHDAPGPLPKIFWWTFVVIVCTASTEFSMLLWASDELRVRGGLTSGASAAALGTLVTGMFIGRLAGSRMTTRMDSEKLYRGSLALSLVGFLGFWATTTITIMLVMLFVTGLGISVQFPMGLDRIMRASDGRADRASGKVSIGAGAASGAAPVLLGLLAASVGVHIAYLIVPIALVIALTIAQLKPVPLIDKALVLQP